MRDGRVDEEVAGLLDPTARSARRSTDTTYGVIKAITACLVLVSAAALVLVRLSHLLVVLHFPVSFLRAAGERARATPSRRCTSNAPPPRRHARATSRARTPHGSDRSFLPRALPSRPAVVADPRDVVPPLAKRTT